MTVEEIRAAWVRWMHRRDMTDDLDTVEAFARNTIRERIMFKQPNNDDLELYGSQVLFQAGMMYLHQLAQDDDGLARVTQLFAASCDDYVIGLSIRNRPTATATLNAGGS